MNLKTLLIGLLLGCFLSGFAVKAEAQDTAGAEWKRYELGNGNLSVLLPEQPKEHFTPSRADAGVPLEARTYVVLLQQGSYVAQYCLLGEVALGWNEATKNSFYDGVWKGAADGYEKDMAGAKLSFKVEMIETREIMLSGHKGREVIFTLGPLMGRMQMTLIGRQAFLASVLGTDKLSLADRRKFIDSFVVSPKPIPVSRQASPA